ncbi:MAG: hypothetical protein ABFD07_03010 [Methanobacterium sp.]
MQKIDKNFVVDYKVFENDTIIHQGKIPLPLVLGGRGGDSSLEGMWNPEWLIDDTAYHGLNRRIEIYFGDKIFVLKDDVWFNKK